MNRRNTRDDEGNSWYTVDPRFERVVHGPFGSEAYAETVAERSSYPEPLEVGKLEGR